MSDQKNMQWNGQDLLFLYQNLTNEIRDFKHKQLVITNYVILLFIAIVGVFKKLNITSSCFIKGCFFALIVILAFIGICYLFNFHNTIQGNRVRLKKIYEKFSEDFRKCLGEIPHNYTSWEYNFRFTLIFIIIILIGLVLASLILFKIG